MTPSRNPAVAWLALRVLPLLAFVLAFAWAPNARADVFAPECDEAGASAIAPIPVVLRAHGEIRSSGCDNYSQIEPSSGVAHEQERAPVSLETHAPWFIVQPAPDYALPKAALSRRLERRRQANGADAHLSSVYRPPR
jgi:hypothetical protein